MINYAHRGFSSRYPENTILAFKEAIKIGANGIELDIHKSKDNVLVVIHDEDIIRTFKGSGQVKDYTLKELKKFKCRKKGFQDNDECIIPTLEEVLKLLVDNEIMLNIELKTDVIHYKDIEKDTIELVNRYKMSHRVILSSFNYESLKICKKLDDRFKTAALYDRRRKDIVSYSKSIEVEAINPRMDLVSRKLIKKAHEQGLKINVFTVNNRWFMRLLIKIGVDGIFTNKPDTLRKIIRD